LNGFVDNLESCSGTPFSADLKYKLTGFIQTVVSKYSKLELKRKADSRNLFLKYRATIDKYSHVRAERISQDEHFNVLFRALSNSDTYGEFSRIDKTLKGKPKIKETL
jgi:hypothetical protein